MMAAAAVLLAGGCDKQPEPADVHAFMLGQVQPTAQTYWDAVQYISDEQGSREIRPRTPEEWARTRRAAERLQALGAQLKTPAFSAGREADWQEFSQGLIDISAQAASAAEARDPERVFAVGASLYNVCSACHQIYLPKTPEASSAAGQ